MEERRDMLRMTYWGKILRMGDDRLTLAAYKEQYKRKEENSWSEKIKKTLMKYGLEKTWERQYVEDNWKETVEKKVREVAERQWMKECKGMSKLRTYIRCKKKLEVSAYLQVEDLEGRRRLAILRSGTNCLRVSTGRWEGRPAEKRICLVCWKEVEDEEHYLMKCIRYKKEREETQESLIKAYKVIKKFR